MGRASFQAEDDADKPARKAGMGSPGPWQPTTDLTPSRVCLFWQNVNASTCQALETHRTVIISSHLLTGIRARRLLAHTTEYGLTVRSRIYQIPFTPGKEH
jgi:hypothetical protein